MNKTSKKVQTIPDEKAKFVTGHFWNGSYNSVTSNSSNKSELQRPHDNQIPKRSENLNVNHTVKSYKNETNQTKQLSNRIEPSFKEIEIRDEISYTPKCESSLSDEKTITPELFQNGDSKIRNKCLRDKSSENLVKLEDQFVQKVEYSSREIKTEIEDMINKMSSTIQSEISRFIEQKNSDHFPLIQNELRSIKAKLTQLEDPENSKRYIRLHNRRSSEDEYSIKTHHIHGNDMDNTRVQNKIPSQKFDEMASIEDPLNRAPESFPTLDKKNQYCSRNAHSRELNRAIQNIIFEAQRNLLYKARMPLNFPGKSQIFNTLPGIRFQTANHFNDFKAHLGNENFQPITRSYFSLYLPKLDYKSKMGDNYNSVTHAKMEPFKQIDKPGRMPYNKSHSISKELPLISCNSSPKKSESLVLLKDEKIHQPTHHAKQLKRVSMDNQELLLAKSRFKSKLEDLGEEIKHKIQD